MEKDEIILEISYSNCAAANLGVAINVSLSEQDHD